MNGTFRISDILMQGEGNALTGRELCTLLQCNARELTAATERERREGSRICASNGSNPGYFLAATQAEMQRYCRSLEHRAGEIHKTRKACIETIPKLPI